jgi:hypothetical protein
MDANINIEPAIVKPDGDSAVPVVPAEEYPPKFTAAEVNGDCPKLLRNIGKQLVAHLDKARKYEEKREQNVTAALQLLAQAEEVCDEYGFAAFKEKFCPDLGRSRAYELKSIATGKKSIEDIRASTRERVARHRAKQTESVTVTDSTAPATDASTLSHDNGASAVDSAEEPKERNARLLSETQSETDEPDDTKCDVDTDKKSDAAPAKPTILELWREAIPKERSNTLSGILEDIELQELLEVLPVHLRIGLEARLLRLKGLQRSAQLTKLLKTALGSRSPAEQITALGRMNEALSKEKLSGNDVHVRVPK